VCIAAVSTASPAPDSLLILLSEHEELPRAYVSLKSEHRNASSEWDIEKWMKERVAKHKQLTGGVVFIDEVPKSPSGKIQRKVLREWAKKDAESWMKRQEGVKL
jgi:acyl-coenzyme A synthetase/AMP-(fatty) acid ligase